MSSPRPDYSAMTVNERLFTAGLIDEWDAAINLGNRQRAIDVLIRVDLEDQAGQIVDTVLANPAKYGHRSPSAS